LPIRLQAVGNIIYRSGVVMTIRRLPEYRLCRSKAKASGVLFLSLLTVCSAPNLFAEETPATSEFEEVVVRAHPLSAEGLAQSTISLSGDALARSLAPNLGEVLGKQPGIHSSSFGAAVGRPVIHGLGGARVRVMEDRLSSMDVSVTSGDHATTVEPFIADSIEVLKGPATLLYGNGAVGGVVDVHTGRVPHGQQDEGISGRVTAQGSDNEDQHAVAGRLDGRSESIAWHIDAFDRRSSNYEIPGETESAALIAQEEAEAAQSGEAHEEEESPGFLPGSHFSTDGGAFGVSYVGDNWFSGIAVSQLNAVYGLPGGHGHHDEEHDGDHDGDHDDHDGDHDGDRRSRR
jgi:iron complex outermembrane receptor protein